MILQCSRACRTEIAMDRCMFNLRLLQQHKTHCGNRCKGSELVVFLLKSMASGWLLFEGTRILPTARDWEIQSCFYWVWHLLQPQVLWDCGSSAAGFCLFCPVTFRGRGVFSMLQFIPVPTPPICCEEESCNSFCFKGVPLDLCARLGQPWRAPVSLGCPWHMSVQQHRHSQPGVDSPAASSQPCQTGTSPDTEKRWPLSTGWSLWEKPHNKSQKSTSCLNQRKH